MLIRLFVCFVFEVFCLLFGGNLQIVKGDGDVFVQVYIVVMFGWKCVVGVWLDVLIMVVVFGVYKVVKWNLLLYGQLGDGWFFSLYCFIGYIKVVFFCGLLLQLVFLVVLCSQDMCYLYIEEYVLLDEVQFMCWVEQVSSLFGECM